MRKDEFEFWIAEFVTFWVFEKRVFVHRKAAKNAERIIFVQSRERRD